MLNITKNLGLLVLAIFQALSYLGGVPAGWLVTGIASEKYMTGPTDLSSNGIRAWLLAKCESLDLTPTSLAKEAKVDPSTINRFIYHENVRHRLSTRTIQKVREAVARLEGAAIAAPSVTAALRQLRLRAGLSMDDVAAALGLKGPSSYQRYEDAALYKGKYLPVEMVELLDAILVGKGEPPITSGEIWALAGIPAADRRGYNLVHIEISQHVTIDQAARIFAILNERGAG